jgi:hypothetical protein
MLKGSGLLALWNGFDPARRAEYDLWHTRQHVPERLAVPGMLRARRYDRGDGPMPEFLTLYELDSTAVLSSPPYLRLMESPTEWSRTMRPSFRDFFRLGCHVQLSRGGGTGGALMALTLDELAGWTSDAIAAAAGAILAETPATAVHFVSRDPGVAGVPFAVAGAGFADAGAILVESYGRAALAETAPPADTILAARGLAAKRGAWTHYELAYALDREALAEIVGRDGPAR